MGDRGCSGSFTTFPEMVRVTSPPLLFTKMDLVKVPGLPWLLYSAVMTADLPGAMASLGHFGVVQPQLADTLDKMRGSVPVFTNLKSYRAIWPSMIFPKLWEVFSNLMLALLLLVVTALGLVITWALATWAVRPAINSEQTTSNLIISIRYFYLRERLRCSLYH